MPKIAILDTYYPDFISELDYWNLGDLDYQSMLQKVLAQGFGTADFYSRNLRQLGWEAIDIIGNYDRLQRLWCEENNIPLRSPIEIVEEQIKKFEPDVLFCQDLSFLPPALLARVNVKILAAQCSCPMPPADNIKQFDIIFTSFPHYLWRLKEKGAKRVEYNQLAFQHTILDNPKADYPLKDVVFIGGVGVPSHWKYGMQVLEAVAKEIPGAEFYGYGYNLLPADSPVKRKYMGPAWGMKMYDIMRNAKIVVNRHGEVAENYANNMRMFEATGCGACLVTDHKQNLMDFFELAEEVREVCSYISPEDAVEKIKYLLNNDSIREKIAKRGQIKTLRQHRYLLRMLKISNCLEGML